MIRLDDGWWLEPSAPGWWLVHVDRKPGGKDGKDAPRSVKSPSPAPPQRYGPFTSPTHAMQQRAVKLPKGVRRGLAALVEVMDSGDAALDDVPPVA
jgi:hypothetical protein